MGASPWEAARAVSCLVLACFICLVQIKVGAQEERCNPASSRARASPWLSRDLPGGELVNS